ncbi:hypothetical protein [Nocardia mexicana]|uniref:Uncharacterized protein n=1 Tax=Nocardia mexicana TaxID=279262 RepID=A0A370H2C3_9NOCA|nr:hypothetical protein [Nocardia mexicana]RDI49187.1 hypothetical protein DFR68_107315 [Nocardia mexicana]
MIDDIDALLEDLSPDDEPETGYDFDDPTFPACPRGCGRHWHGMHVTERIEAMHHRGFMDPGYRYREDDSPILCPAPDFIGPHRPPDFIGSPRPPDFGGSHREPGRVESPPGLMHGMIETPDEYAEVYLRRGLPPPTARSRFDPASLWPYLPREPHREHARGCGYFWLPCPLCGNHFGGHEIVGSIRGDENEQGRTTWWSICPVCTAERNGGRP